VWCVGCVCVVCVHGWCVRVKVSVCVWGVCECVWCVCVSVYVCVRHLT